MHFDDLPTTQWSLVLAARERKTTESQIALEQLCRVYWPPLYAFARRRVADVHEAQDLTQAFFERLLEKNYLAAADPVCGRFRAFLLSALKHFLAKEWEKARAQKRGGGRISTTFDFVAQDAAELARELTPEQVFDRQWTITLLTEVMQRLEREMERAGRGRQYHLLKHLLVGDEGPTYAAIAPDVGLKESALRMAVSRMRQRYRELLRQEIARTVDNPDNVEDELRGLFRAFQG